MFVNPPTPYSPSDPSPDSPPDTMTESIGMPVFGSHKFSFDPSIKNEKAKQLWQLIQNHRKSDSLFYTERGVIAYAIDKFSRFLKWILRTSHIDALVEKRIQFGMNLFRNYEFNLFGPGSENSAVPAGHDLPFSVALEAYCHCLEKYPIKDFGSIQPLKECLEYAKKIEKAKTLSASSRESLLKDLAQQLKDKIAQLSKDETLYIPGGLIEYEGLNGLSENIQALTFRNKKLRTTHFFFEIRKHPDEGKLIFRIFNYSNQINKLAGNNGALFQIFENLENISDLLDQAKKVFPFIDELVEQAKKTLSNDSQLLEYHLDENELSSNLFTLLQVQATPHISHNMGWWSSFQYHRALASRVINWLHKVQPSPPQLQPAQENTSVQEPEEGSSSSHEPQQAASLQSQEGTSSGKIVGKRVEVQDIVGPLVEDLSITQLSTFFDRIRPYQSASSTPPAASPSSNAKCNSKTDPVKLLEIFTKAVHQEDLTEIKMQKLMSKTALFLELYAEAETKLASDSKMRKWIKDNAINLLKAYLRYFGSDAEKSSEDFKQIIGYFESIVHKIEEASHHGFILPAEPNHQKPLSTDFDNLLVFEGIPTPLDEFQTLRKPTLSLQKPLCGGRFSLNTFKSWIETCNSLSSQKKLHDLYLILEDVFHALENADAQKFWDDIALEDLEAWSSGLEKLCFFSVQVHFGTSKPGPLPRSILNLIKLLWRTQYLAQRNNKETCFGNFSLDTDQFRDIFLDSYLDLEAEGPEIKEVLSYIEGRENKTTVNLTDSSSFKNQEENDKAFFALYRKAHHIPEDCKYTPPEEDFGSQSGQLAPQTIHLRRMKIMTTALMAKHRCLGNHKIFNRAKQFIQSAISFLRRQITTDFDTDLDRDLAQRAFDQVDSFLKRGELACTFTKNTFALHRKPTVKIEELGVDFFDYVDTAYVVRGATPISQYKKTAQEVPASVEKQVVEAVVSNDCDIQDTFVDEEGKVFSQTEQNGKKRRYSPPGEHHTEGTIGNDHLAEMDLPQDHYAELRLTKTSPLGTRIPNTLQFLYCHPQYFNYSKQGLALQRIISLNLFRNNNLQEFLLAAPNYATTLVKLLRLVGRVMQSANNLQGVLFLMKVIRNVSQIVDTIPSIDNDVFAQIEKDHFCILTDWQQNCDEKKELKPHRKSIYQTYLLTHAERFQRKFKDPAYDPSSHQSLRADTDTLLNVLHSHYCAQRIPKPMHERNRAHEDKISYMMHRLFPACAKLLADPILRDPFLNNLIPSEKGHWTSCGNNDLCFINENDVSVDLVNGLLYKEGVAESYLPDTITHELSAVVHFHLEEIHEIPCKQRPVLRDGKKGQMYEFVYRKQTYRIVLMPGQEHHIYKYIDQPGNPANWYELKRTISLPEKDPLSFLENMVDSRSKALKELAQQEETKTLPDEILANNFWISPDGNHFIIENAQGNYLYRGEFIPSDISNSSQQTKFNIQHATRITSCAEESQTLLNPWHRPEFLRFLALANPSQIMVLGQKYKAEQIKYLNQDLEYAWNNAESRWDCKTLPGYWLSLASFDDIMNRNKAENEHLHLFDNSFTDYQILEHKSKPPRLLLMGTQLNRSTSSNRDEYITKYNRKKIAANHSETASIQYQYEIDPLSGLKASSQEEYLYLVYTFLVQSRFDVALFYLDKAQNIKPGKSSECDRILQLIENWVERSKSPSARAVFLQIQILVLSQVKRFGAHQYEQMHKILENLDKYADLVSTCQIDPRLQLSSKQQAQLDLYKAKITSENNREQYQSLANSLGEVDLEKITNALAVINSASKKNKAKIDKETIKLKKEIEDLKKEISSASDAIQRQPSKNLPKPDHLFPDFEKYLTCGTQLHLVRGETTTTENVQFNKNNMDFLEAIDKLKQQKTVDPFEKELLEELVNDINIAASNQNEDKNVLNDSVNLDEIKESLTDYANALEEAAIIARQNILTKLSFGIPPDSKLESVLKKLQEYPATQERNFRRILMSCANGDWKDLEKEKIVLNQDIEEIKTIASDYLVRKTKLNQYKKAIAHIDDFEKTKLHIHLARLGEILAIKRHYDPYKDPNRFSLLLLEDHQQVIIKKDQLDHYIINQHWPNLFSHEPLASGKTSILRHLDADIHADGSHIAGITTDDALIGQHHPLLESTTLEAYNKLADRFEFSRESDSSALALRILYRNLLKIIPERGRLDFTKRDFLSLHHLSFQKLRELELKLRPEDEIHEELDILADIYELIKEKLRVGTDEMDQVTNPTIEHNWGIGTTPLKLDEKKCEIALLLMEWTLENETYKDLFTKGNQFKLASDPKKYLEYLANRACGHFKLDTRLTDTVIDYFTSHFDQKQNMKYVIDFYEDHIKTHQEKEKLVYLYKFLQSVVPHSLSKRNGARFMRSTKDHMTVKPTLKNASYNELSEHCSEEELAWYTCVNYMHSEKQKQGQGGVTTDQIAHLVLNAKNQASIELMNSINIDENPIDFRDTKEAKAFYKDFKLHLDKVMEDDYAKIADEINQSPQKLSAFIESRVFPLIELRAEKFTGNTQHFVNMFNQFYGSSGTSNSYRALPDKVVKIKGDNKDPEDFSPAKKRGVDGAVLLALLKDFKDEDLLCYDDNKEILPQISERLTPGSMFIDLAPVFPGLNAKEIAHDLAAHLPKAKFRYLNELDQAVILDSNTGEERPAHQNDDLETVMTILSKDQERGTHLEMAPEAIGFPTVNSNTTLTEFQQAIMRMRRLGRGQKVKILIAEDTFKCLEEPKVAQLILLLVKNEIKSLKQHHTKAEREKILALAQCNISDVLCTLKDRQLRLPIWIESKGYFAHKTQERIETDEDLDYMGKPRPEISGYDDLMELISLEKGKIKKFEKKISNLKNKNLKKLHHNLAEAKAKLKEKANNEVTAAKYLLSSVDSRHHNLGMQSQMQHEHEAVKEQDQEQEQFQEQFETLVRNAERYLGKPWEDLGIKSIDDIIKMTKGKNSNALSQLNDQVSESELNDQIKDSSKRISYSFYDDNIFVTKNICPLERMYLYRTVIVVDKTKNGKDAVTCVAGSLKDFDNVFNGINPKNDRYDYYIFNLWYDQLERHQTKWKKYEKTTEKAIVRAIVQMKHLAGAIVLTEFNNKDAPPIFRQKSVLIKWLHELKVIRQLNLKNLEDLQKKYLTTMRPTNFASYQTSSMREAYRLASKV